MRSMVEGARSIEVDLTAVAPTTILLRKMVPLPRLRGGGYLEA